MRKATILLGIFVYAMTLTGCGGGGGGGGETDLRGVWTASATSSGAPAPKALFGIAPPSWLSIEQVGAVVYARTSHTTLLFTGSISGSTVQIDGSMETTTFSATLTVTNQDTLTGQLTITQDGESPINYQFVLSRQGAGEGSLTCDGELSGENLDVDTTKVFATRDSTLTNERRIIHAVEDRVFTFLIRTNGAPSATTYTLTSDNTPEAGNVYIQMQNYSTSSGSTISGVATGGTLNISNVSDASISGYFSATLLGTDGVITSCSFTAPVRIVTQSSS